MKNILILFCIGIVIFSCKKEEIKIQSNFTFNYTEPISNNLEPLDYSQCDNLSRITINDYVYTNAIFNPLNSNEIAYLRTANDNDPKINQLYTFNFETGLTRKLVDQRIKSFDWSVNDDISFITKTNELWIMKSDGSDLRQIEANHIRLLNTWNDDGTKLLIDSVNGTLGQGQYKRVIDINGQVIKRLDSLEYHFFFYPDWQESNLCYDRAGSVHLFNIDRNEVSDIKTFSGIISEVAKDAQFFKTSSVIWLTSHSLKSINMGTGTEKLIQSSNDRIDYQQFDISNDNRNILLEVTFNTMFEECSYHSEKQLLLINNDGTGLRRINIPE